MQIIAMNERYSRQLELIGESGQKELANARVLCIGAGGLGSLVSSFLVAAGVGYLAIVDDDTVHLTNLTRQIIYHEKDCGQSKVQVLCSHLTNLNSSSQIIAIAERLNACNALQIIKSYDLILDCSDNFTTRYLVNDWCQICDRPLISGSIDGFTGQVMVFLNDVCYRCVFPDLPKRAANCFDGVVIGSAVGIVASTQANEAFKYLTRISESSCLIQIDSLSNQVNRYQLTVSRTCSNYSKHYKSDNSTVSYLKWSEVLEREKITDLTLLDIRSKEVQVSLPLANAVAIDNPHDLKQFKQRFLLNQELVIVCSLGVKSKLVAQHLQQTGFKQIHYTRF